MGRLYRIDDSERGRTTFLHDGDALVAEYGAGGVLLRRYIHGADVGADDPLVWYEGAGVTDAGRRFLRRDARGSIVAVSDHLGNPIAINAYDEYGIPEQAGIAAGAADNLGRFQYTGQLWIPEVGLYYYKARWYSPTLGRFLQTDPIGYEDQFNLYVYVGNDPVNGVDPTGMDACYGTSQCGTKQLTAEDKAVQQAILEGTVFVAAAGLDIMNTPVSPGPDFIIVVTGTREVAKRPGWFRRFVNWVTGKKCCFVAGTLVDTEDGLRPIEEVAIGDNVWARDEETGETELKAVTDLIRLHERVIWEVALTGPEGETEQFETTDDHPWWVAGQGWKATGELKAGMAVVTRDGRGMLVASVAETGRTDATYNLTVADFETYFVGEQRVLVHNCPTGSYEHTFSSRKTYDGKGDPGRAARTGREIARDNNDPLVSTEHRTATSDRESFIQESRSLDRNGGPGSDRNYNKIESPGKRMRREDGEID